MPLNGFECGRPDGTWKEKRGKKGREREGGREEAKVFLRVGAAPCCAVLWRGRGQNIFWKEATKGHYSDDHGGDERQKKGEEEEKILQSNIMRKGGLARSPSSSPPPLAHGMEKKKTFSN